MDLEVLRGSPIYITALKTPYVCVLVGPQHTRTAHGATHKQAKGRNPTLWGNTQYPSATQLALASSLIQDTLKRLEGGLNVNLSV